MGWIAICHVPRHPQRLMNIKATRFSAITWKPLLRWTFGTLLLQIFYPAFSRTAPQLIRSFPIRLILNWRRRGPHILQAQVLFQAGTANIHPISTYRSQWSQTTLFMIHMRCLRRCLSLSYQHFPISVLIHELMSPMRWLVKASFGIFPPLF